MSKRFDYDSDGKPHYNEETIAKRRRAMLFAMRKRGELSDSEKRRTNHDDWLRQRREDRHA